MLSLNVWKKKKVSVDKETGFVVINKTNKTFLERNIMTISTITLIAGVVLLFVMPFFMSFFHYYDKKLTPNEVGDAFGGIANPVVTLVGVFSTFMAFYIQYKANERQTGELESQKAKEEQRFIKESISNLKSDIMLMRYTKNGVTYSHSEAIWEFMLDNISQKENIEAGLGLSAQQYFQISYLLTLFEPLIEEIDTSKLEDKEKEQILQNLDGLFEASFAFILRLEDKIKKEKEKVNSYVRRKIIVPVKRVKILLTDTLNKYKESEKEIFLVAVSKIKAFKFLKQTRYVNQQGTLIFYKDYKEYVKNNEMHLDYTEQEFSQYFRNEEQFDKIIVTEPVRLLMKLSFLNQITLEIYTENRNMTLAIDRDSVEDYLDIDLEEMNIDKEIWRDSFQGMHVFDAKGREAFLDKFTKRKKIKTTE
ncbi:MAG: hypothetical protein EAZ85_03550 [Bacteroidetes bacterium]|nr:MAG: hypothetical protein EAZ85_03550 [Bacteroidota bacterium]TAG87385.1 MAG: hypothetical protein EAZ20_10720 [Bacteroidota bacterium]